MYKKIIVLSALLATGIWFAKKSSDSGQIESTHANLTDSGITNQTEVKIQSAFASGNPEKPSQLSESEVLKQEIATLKSELKGINVEKELNNKETSQIRREFIISKMNLYAKKMGMLAKIEIAAMKAELEK